MPNYEEQAPKGMNLKKAAAIVSMVTLGVCAAAFVVSSSSASVQGEDDIRNVYGPHIIGLAEKNLHTQLTGFTILKGKVSVGKFDFSCTTRYQGLKTSAA